MKVQLDQFFPLVDSKDVYIEEIIEIFSGLEKASALKLSKPGMFKLAKLRLVMPANSVRAIIFFNKTYQTFFRNTTTEQLKPMNQCIVLLIQCGKTD